MISSTLLDTVAMSEPAMTVKVMRAMLVEKYFMPKNEDVKAAVMVGHAPQDMPVRHSPVMHKSKNKTKMH